MLTLKLSEDYLLHVSVSAVDRAVDQYHLKIQSQWLGAKDPDGLQTRYSVTLPGGLLRQLGQHIVDEAKL